MSTRTAIRWLAAISLVILGGGMGTNSMGGVSDFAKVMAERAMKPRHAEWKEEILLHDGRIMVVERSFRLGGYPALEAQERSPLDQGAGASLAPPPTVLTGTATGNYLNDPDTGSRKVEGRAGKDMIWGAIAADQLYGGDGDDWIMGNLGADHIEGGIGNDYITGLGDGADVKGDTEGRDTIVLAAATGLGAGGLPVVNTSNQGQYRQLNIALYAAYAQTDSTVSNAENDGAWKEAA